MKTQRSFFRSAFRVLLLLAGPFVFTLLPAQADTWSGLGPDGKWLDGANWVGGTPPAFGSTLIFTGTGNLNTTNNFTSGTVFNLIEFASPAGPFVLGGNPIGLTGGISDNQALVPETINLNIALSQPVTMTVGSGALLSLNGVLSGENTGFTLTGGGQLTLNGNNTLTGTINLDSGTVVVSTDSNLGVAPASATPGDIVILSGGNLHTTNNFTLNANRGVFLGNTTGTNTGTIQVDTGTMTYQGVMANNGAGVGGLNKLGFGDLTISAPQTYTGPTEVEDGILTLDFSQTVSPLDDVVNTNSSLTFGGAPAGFNFTNNATLLMIGGATKTNTQSFNGTTVTLGPTLIRATNGTGGSATLNLGLLSHDSGSTAVIVPPWGTGGAGTITTTATNLNGILGGWVLLGNGTLSPSGGALPVGTNWACVDANGNITNYAQSAFDNFGSATTSDVSATLLGPGSNLLFSPTTTTHNAFAADNAGVTTDVNSVMLLGGSSGSTLSIGLGNTLRLGRFGGILKQDNLEPTIYFGGEAAGGVQSGNGNNADGTGSQGEGTMTAGGGPNSPGEIVITCNGESESSGTIIFEMKITDNGTNPVAVIKKGTGSIKLDGHNTFSGGFYILEGRVQYAGTEPSGGTSNPDGGGTGPLYIFPGAYWFPSGSETTNMANPIFVGGLGDSGESGIGAIRGDGNLVLQGKMTLISNARLGSGSGTPMILGGQVTGPYSLELCSAATVNGAIGLSNSLNNWTGTTTMNARNAADVNTVRDFTNEVIPNGVGFGNVVMNGNTSTGIIVWDLNGWNETINGLSTTTVAPTGLTGTANPLNCFISNQSLTISSTLAVGDNNSSGSFGGNITAGQGIVNLVKIGDGVETLTSTNTFQGFTTVSNGTLAIGPGGAVSNTSDVTVESGATLDISRATSPAFALAQPLNLDGGTLLGNSLSAAGALSTLNLNNGALSVNLNPNVTNVYAAALTTGGTSNLINILSVTGITGYPTAFTVLQYSGSLGGAGLNIQIGAVPSPVTGGYVSNDTVGQRIIVVLTNGPKSQVWTGLTDGTTWDVGITTNWIGFGTTPDTFNDADSVQFDDTILLSKPGATNITLAPAQPILPSAVVVSNSSANYNFGGSGEIGGGTGLVKLGSGSLVVSNTGGNYFNGGIVISNGGSVTLESSSDTISGGVTIGPGSTLQIGVGSGGSMPSGSVDDEGSLILDSGTVLPPITGNIFGAGSVTKLDPTFLVLGGNNTFAAGLTVAAGGTIQCDSSGAISTNTAIFASGSTLDVDGQDLGAVTVTVSGTGVGGVGAITNSGGAAENALQNVIMAGPTTFGGGGRWDIRSNPGASLSTGGNAYDLTKIGNNQVSLVGVTVDAALNNINVDQGIFSVQEGTTGIGNPSANLTVAAGGTLDFYAASGTYAKNYILNGDGVDTTLEIESSTATMSGPVTFNNNCLVLLAGTSLTLASGGSGSGTMGISGPGELQLQGTLAYAGNISLTEGTLEFDSVNASGAGTLTVASAGVLQSGGGVGGVTGAVQVNGTLNPGGSNSVGGLATGPLTLNSATVNLDEGTSSSLDTIAATGNLVLTGTTVLMLNPQVGTVTAGLLLTNITYTGTLTGGSNNLQVVSTVPGFTYQLLNPATTPGAIVISVLHVPQSQTWRGGATGAPNTWDVGVTHNWVDTSSNNILDAFSQGDNVNFDDTATTPNVTVAVPVSPLSIQFDNFNDVYRLTGPGALLNVPWIALSGAGTVVLDNGGAGNTITGGVVNGGTLQLGNDDTNGTVGSGNITNNGLLYFDHSDTLSIPGNLSSIGSIIQIGSGVTVLTGNNTNYYGSVIISNGTLRLGSATALPTANNIPIAVSNGATLDITNNENIGLGTVLVGGSGVGGLGAIINSSGSTTFVAPNLAYIQMTSDLTIGGTGRLDLRDATGTGFNAALSTGGVPMNFIKAGPNQLQMTGVQVDSALSNITVEAGELGLQANMSGLGNPTNLLTVWSNATLQFYQLSNTMFKVLILSNDATVDDSSGPAVWGGPVTLNGSNTFDVAANLLIDNIVGGSGTLILAGGTLALSQSNTYTGQTLINSGTLQLTNDNDGVTNGSISSSPLIDLAGGANIDVSLLTPAIFNVVGGQTLTGAGNVLGSLNVNSGGTINTVAGGTLAATNALSLAGTTIMPISGTPVVSSSLATTTGNISYGGVLIVTNTGGTITGGESYQLFKSGGGGYSGSFSSVTLPPLGNGLSWNTSQLSVSGTISVSGTLQVLSFNPGVTRSGTTLNVSGSGGTPNGTYYVLGSTNLALPTAQWTPVATNSFDGSGNFTFSISTTSEPNEYYVIEE